MIDAKAQFSSEPIGGALSLATDILVERAAINRILAVEDEVRRTEEEIITGKVELVIAGVAERAGIRSVLSVPGAPTIKGLGIVNHAPAFAVDESAIEALVAVAFP